MSNTTYIIETRPANSTDASDWTTDGIGDQNEFATAEAAEAAIEELRAIGPDWADADYRVVER